MQFVQIWLEVFVDDENKLVGAWSLFITISFDEMEVIISLA